MHCYVDGRRLFEHEKTKQQHNNEKVKYYGIFS